MKFQALWENMTVRSDPLGGEDFVSNLQKSPETSQGEKSGIAPISGETYTDYWGKYTTKLKQFFPQATDEQIEALLYYKKHGMKKEYDNLYNKLYYLKPENRNRKNKRLKQRFAQKYTNDPEFRKRYLERQNQRFAQKYANDPEFRKRHIELKKQKWANDPEYRKRKIELQRKRRANNPEFRKRDNERRRQKWANDPEYRKRHDERRKRRRLMKKLGTFNQFVQNNPNP